MGPTTALEKIRRKLKPHAGGDASAAVAIILSENEGGAELLLVKRAVLPGDPWSGDMAFPGGKKGPLDRSIVDTAIREVNEETNIVLDVSQCLGRMDIFFSTARPDLSILPMVFMQGKNTEIRINEELISYHWVPLKRLAGSKERAVVKGLEVPVFHVNSEVVWGLTYRIIEKLLELVQED